MHLDFYFFFYKHIFSLWSAKRAGDQFVRIKNLQGRFFPRLSMEIEAPVALTALCIYQYRSLSFILGVR